MVDLVGYNLEDHVLVKVLGLRGVTVVVETPHGQKRRPRRIHLQSQR